MRGAPGSFTMPRTCSLPAPCQPLASPLPVRGEITACTAGNSLNLRHAPVCLHAEPGRRGSDDLGFAQTEPMEPGNVHAEQRTTRCYKRSAWVAVRGSCARPI